MKTRILFSVLMAVLFAIGFVNCSPNNDIAPAVPTVATSNLTAVAIASADLSGEVSSENGAAIDTRGFCWSTNENPTPNDGHAIVSGTTGSMSAKLTGLSANTIYYVRAYAINKAGIGYGEVKKFQTYAVADQDGNLYHTITIGTQTWMVENLRATHYRNGDAINKASGVDNWHTLTAGAYIAYNNNYADSLIKKYGYLYNHIAAVDSRNLAPAGWHVPTLNDWNKMYSYVGPLFGNGMAGYVSGPQMMATTDWVNPIMAPDNKTGFSALPAGLIYYDGSKSTFYNQGTQTFLMTTDLFNDSLEPADFRSSQCFFEINQLFKKECGASVRLIKD